MTCASFAGEKILENQSTYCNLCVESTLRGIIVIVQVPQLLFKIGHRDINFICFMNIVQSHCNSTCIYIL